MKIPFKNILIIPVITAALSVALLMVTEMNLTTKNTKLYSEFSEDISSKNVSEVHLTKSDTISVTLKDGTTYKTDNPESTSLKEELLKEGIIVSAGTSTSLGVIGRYLFFISLLAIGSILIKKSYNGTRGIVGVDSLENSSSENSLLTLKDIAGNEEAKESVMDIIDFLKNPTKYRDYGARMPKGIILYGDPGTGKTLLARAVAGEAGVPFYAMSGSDFIQVYVGVGASRIRQLFKKARSHGKAVIFIDEIDAIGKARGNSASGGSDERDQTLNALLTEMSGFNETEGIIVMAATNRLDILDSALLRPGRFDRHIEITLPDILAREKILNLHLKNKPHENIQIKEWSQKTSYFSGAKLEHLVNEAAILACKDNSKDILDAHMDKAYSIVLAGYDKMNRDYIKANEKRITGFHEIGHALASHLLLPMDKVSKVTIIPTTKGAGGYTLSIPEDSMYQNKDYLKKRIMVMLGGRAAEEIIFGSEKITTGALNDLKESTSLAVKMVSQFGMGDSLGLLSLEALPDKYSSSISIDIIKECKSLIEILYEDTKKLLSDNIDMLNALTEDLLEKETLYYEDILRHCS